MEHNCGRYCPILIILSLFRQKLSAHRNVIKFATSPTICCRITLKNATAYTSSQKLHKSAMHAVISLLLQSSLNLVAPNYFLSNRTQKLTEHTIVMCFCDRNCCQQYAECLVITLCSSRTVHRHTAHARATVELRPICGLRTAQISVLWITRSGLSRSVLSTREKSIVWMN